MFQFHMTHLFKVLRWLDGVQTGDWKESDEQFTDNTCRWQYRHWMLFEGEFALQVSAILNHHFALTIICDINI